MAYNVDNRSERLLQGRRFTTDDLLLSQEAFTDVFDLGASEIYTDDGLIPTGSTQLPFSGSTQNNLIISASVVDPSISVADNLPILKYHYRKKLKAASNATREVYYFTTSDPSSVSDTVTSDQLIETDQQTSFISPKYIIASDSPNNTEANPPGYKVVVYKDTASSAGSITSDPADPSTYVFDFKTGVLTWISNAPASNQFVYISVYQYVGRTLRSQIDDGSIVTDSGSFATRLDNLEDNLVVTATSISESLGDNATLIRSLTATSISESFVAPSSSFSTRVTNLEDTTADRTFGQITASGDISASGGTGSFGYVDVDTDVTIGNNLFVGGFALESILFNLNTGSTQFGSSSADRHEFTGSLFISGSSVKLNGSDLLTAADIDGDSATIQTQLLGESTFAASISGSFVAPSSSFATRLDGLEDNLVVTAASISESLGDNASLIRSLTATSISESFVAPSSSFATRLDDLEDNLEVTATSVSESLGDNASLIRSLTATSISESFVAPSSSFSTRVTSLEDTTADRTFGQISVSHISASGNITASGLLFASLSLGDNSVASQTVMYDTGSGRFYFTGSYGGGGGGTIGGFSAVGEDILPDGTHNLGAFDNKWQAIFAEDTFFGGIHEINLETKGLDQLQAGTVLVSKGGKMVPCTTEADPLIMGIVSSGSNFPIILGAEPVLVHGAVYEGDYIITSNVLGHGKAVNPNKIYEQQLFGKIIAQSLETKIQGGIIRAMIRKL